MLVITQRRDYIENIMSTDKGYEIIHNGRYDKPEDDSAYYGQVLEGNLEAHIVTVCLDEEAVEDNYIPPFHIPFHVVVFIASSISKADPRDKFINDSATREVFREEAEGVAHKVCDASNIPAPRNIGYVGRMTAGVARHLISQQS